jgi:hypothetical protein
VSTGRLRDVHHLVALQNREIGALPDIVHELAQRRPRPKTQNRRGAGAERGQFWTEHVLAGRHLTGVPEFDHRAHQTVNGHRRHSGELRELCQPGDAVCLGDHLQQREGTDNRLHAIPRRSSVTFFSPRLALSERANRIL